jgi:hypothetical protein
MQMSPNTVDEVFAHARMVEQTADSALCLPQIKPEHIGDAVHPKSDGKECVPLPRRHVISARPCSTISECACHYSCACRKSNPNILVVQPAQDRAAKNGPG